jgi:T5SS/PEP-CTERM-associated repeat protein/autotransporter-associated beta strand protein
VGAVAVRGAGFNRRRIRDNRARMRRLLLMSVSIAALTVLSAGSAAAQAWLGTTSSDWTNGANWSSGTPPVAGGTVTISNTTGANPILGLNGADTGTMAGLTIGSAGTNTLTIQNGSTLTNTAAAMIGTNATGTSTVTVTGAGTEWNAVGQLTVGNVGTGILNIENSALVLVTVSLRAGPTTGTGTVNISDGTLQTPRLTVGATSQMNFDNATLRATQTNASWITSTGTLNIAAGGLTVDTSTFSVGMTPTSAFSGVGGLTKIGLGTLSLFADNTYAGETLIQAGTLSLVAAGSIAASSRVVVDGTLNVSQATTPAIKSLAGSGGVTLGANNLTVTNANDQFSGIISGTGGLILTGGMLDLSGPNAYTGATDVNGGALRSTAQSRLRL